MSINWWLLPLTALGSLLYTPNIQAEQQYVTIRKEYEESHTVSIVLNTMEVVKSPLSKIRRLKVAKKIARVAIEIFENPERRKDWIVLLGMESRFESTAVSKRGAVGIGQVMPQFARGFALMCGLKSFKQSQLADTETNAELSACVFNGLADQLEGSTSLALVAYNAGPYSRDLKAMQDLRNINSYTANYLSRFVYIRELISRNNVAMLTSLNSLSM